MKQLLAFLLFSGSVLAQTVPNRTVDIGLLPSVTIGNPQTAVVSTSRSTQTIRRNEGRNIEFPVQVSTVSGAYNNTFAGLTTGRNWATAANSTTQVAYSSQLIPTYSNLEPSPGRKWVIWKITILSNKDVEFDIQKEYNRKGTLYGNTGAILQGAVIDPDAEIIRDTTGGKTVFTYSDNAPKVIKYGERLRLYYVAGRGKIQQPNFKIIVNGLDFTNDDNETAPHVMLVVGDSRSGITQDGAPQFDTDYWTFRVRDSLIAYGKNTRLVNMAIKGTDVGDWHSFANNNDQAFNIPFSSVHINLGSNDCPVASYLSTGGVDGKFKTGLKYLIRKFYMLNPQALIFINSIGPTDTANRTPNLAAFRAEIAACVSEMAAQGIQVYLCDISNAFPASDGSYFIGSESVAGNRLHESSKGHAAEAVIIWPVVKAHLSQLKPAR